MTDQAVVAQIAKRPAVHWLCYGAFLQSPIWISCDVLAVPLASLGFNAEVGYVTTYLQQFFGIGLTSEQVKTCLLQGAERLPVVTVIHYPLDSASPEGLEAGAREKLDRAEQIISWVSGERLTEFAYVTLCDQEAPFFRMVPPHTRRRQRIGFGNPAEALQDNVDRIRQAAEEDPRFAFAMANFADASYELNPLFKVCRLFNILEGLAYALKGEEVGSRRAVKLMLGLETGAMCSVQVDGREISYDRIEIAGRLRDKFFHGTPFREEDLIVEARHVFYLIKHYPELIADTLQADCEISLARWANNASPARDAAHARSQS